MGRFDTMLDTLGLKIYSYCRTLTVNVSSIVSKTGWDGFSVLFTPLFSPPKQSKEH